MIEVGDAHRRRDLHGRLDVAAAERVGGNELVLEHPGVVELREPVVVLVEVVVGLEERLVAPLPVAARRDNRVEIERQDVVQEDVVRAHQHLVAADHRRAARLKREQLRLASEDQGRADCAASGKRPGVQRVPGAGHEAGCKRIEVRKPVAVEVELLVRDVAVAVGVQGGGRPGDVQPPVHQVLGQAIPAGDLVAREVVEHAAELKLHGADIEVEGGLQQGLLDIAVAVVAARVLRHAVQPVAEVLGAQTSRSTDLPGKHEAIPGPEVDAHRAHRGVDELPGLLDARRLRREVQIAADLRRSVNGRGRTAHDVDPLRRTERGRVVARIVEAPHAAKVGLPGRAADVERAGNAEERLRKAPRRKGDHLVDVAHDEAVHHLVANCRRGPRRRQQGLVEAEQGTDIVVGQTVEVGRDDKLLDLGGFVQRRRRLLFGAEDDTRRKKWSHGLDVHRFPLA